MLVNTGHHSFGQVVQGPVVPDDLEVRKSVLEFLERSDVGQLTGNQLRQRVEEKLGVSLECKKDLIEDIVDEHVLALREVAFANDGNVTSTQTWSDQSEEVAQGTPQAQEIPSGAFVGGKMGMHLPVKEETPLMEAPMGSQAGVGPRGGSQLASVSKVLFPEMQAAGSPNGTRDGKSPELGTRAIPLREEARVSMDAPLKREPASQEEGLGTPIQPQLRVGQKRPRDEVGAKPECDCGGEVLLHTTKYGKNEGREYYACITCGQWLQWRDDKNIPVPKCHCGLRARKATAGKNCLPHNVGREFYGCPKWPKPDKCDFFIWADGTLPFGPEAQARFNKWAGCSCSFGFCDEGDSDVEFGDEESCEEGGSEDGEVYGDGESEDEELDDTASDATEQEHEEEEDEEDEEEDEETGSDL